MEVSFSSKSIFGFPKGVLLIYQDGTNFIEQKLISYGVFNVPFANGTYENFEIPTFVPFVEDSFFFKEVKIFDNLDFLLTSLNRSQVKVKSRGIVKCKIIQKT